MPFSSKFVFVDTGDHFYERLMKNEGIALRHIREFTKEGSPFRLIICRIRNCDKTSFCESIIKIRDMALLLGYREYDDMCRLMQSCESEAVAG